MIAVPFFRRARDRRPALADDPQWSGGQVDLDTGQIAKPAPEPEPPLPDGIEDGSRDLPNLYRAAERVRAYIEATGDGLYDVQGGAPLYGRDLEALTRHALAVISDAH